MQQNEGFFDLIINSLKYSVSNVSALLIGGLVVILSSVLIGLPFLLGYVTRCGRQILKGNNVMPEWEGIGELFKDGMMVLAIGLLYALITGLLYAFATVFLTFGDLAGSDILVALGILIFIPSVIVAIVLGLLFYLSWVVYAVTGDIMKALNPVNGLKLGLKNPIGYIIALIATWIIGLILFFPGLLIVTSPWLGIISATTGAYIYARYYQKTAADGVKI